MAFSENDIVYVIPLKGNGTVTKVLKQGHYQVLVGNMQIKCKDSDLKPATGKVKTKASPGKVQKSYDIKRKKRKTPVISVDLHGYIVDDAIREVEDKLNQAVLSGCEELEIIHGIGTGKVRRAVHELLGSLSIVKQFRLDPLNAGTTRVFL